jgi:hypothetical protein
MDGSDAVLYLWRGVLRHMQGEELKKIVTKECPLDDVLWLLDQLSEDDISRVQKVAALTPIQMISEMEVIAIVKDLDSYAWSLTWKKLRFIAQYDSAIEMGDLHGEIMQEIVRVIRIYQHLGNRDKIKGYAMRAAHNEMAKLIEHYTARSRARIQQVADTLDSSLPQYRTTTLSLDTPSKEDAGISLHGIVSSGGGFESSCIEKEFFVKLTLDIAPRVRRLIQIVCDDDFDPEFESYLRTRGLDPEKIALIDPLKLAKIAAEHLKLDMEEVRTVVALKMAAA